MWVIAVVCEAPCQCFSFGPTVTTSPGRISSIGPPQRWWRPQPKVTISVCPSGWVCQSLRAQGSKVTYAPPTRPGGLAWKRGSSRTVPVKCSAGARCEGRDPFRLMAMSELRSGDSDDRLDCPAFVHGLVRLDDSVQASLE